DWAEMYKVFNMGSRMELYVSETDAQTVIDIAREHGIDAQIIGRVEPSDTRRLTITSPYGTFEY
ncbi:MAG: phosphoribosylformylglycinamidine cyclo-ligase, partial [Muribaculaceae bacterium]|nr:phosphoribosylformylglycinamidine cyclo-ligase [Muribaculaceae bacterium]